MNWNEFKTAKDAKGKMNFIVTDNETDNIFDINDPRKYKKLRKIFSKIS